MDNLNFQISDYFPFACLVGASAYAGFMAIVGASQNKPYKFWLSFVVFAFCVFGSAKAWEQVQALNDEWTDVVALCVTDAECVELFGDDE